MATEFSKPFDKDALKLQSDKIVYSGDLNGNKVLMLSGIDDKTVLEALYLHNQNKHCLMNLKPKLKHQLRKISLLRLFRK